MSSREPECNKNEVVSGDVDLDAILRSARTETSHRHIAGIQTEVGCSASGRLVIQHHILRRGQATRIDRGITGRAPRPVDQSLVKEQRPAEIVDGEQKSEKHAQG